MKQGDKIPVQIGPHTVAQAEIKEMADGTATLIIPATQVIMGIRSELTDLPTTAPTVQTIIDDAVRQPAETVVDASAIDASAVDAPTDTAPTVANAPTVEAPTADAPPVDAPKPEAPAPTVEAPKADTPTPPASE